MSSSKEFEYDVIEDAEVLKKILIDENHNDDDGILAKAYKFFKDVIKVTVNETRGEISKKAAIIINIACTRTPSQLQKIVQQYEVAYERDLLKDLDIEIFGSFKQLILSRFVSMLTFYAQELNRSLKGLGTDKLALIDILCTTGHSDIKKIEHKYQELYDISLKEDIEKNTSGSFRLLLLSLLNVEQETGDYTGFEVANLDATKLFQAGEAYLGTDEATFFKILIKYRFTHINEIRKQYQDLIGNSLEGAIDNEFSGYEKLGLLAIVKVADDERAYFTERLCESMKGLGTDDAAIIRIFTMQRGNLKELENQFFKKYRQTLKLWIDDDCSGAFKKCLLTLLNPSDVPAE